MTAKYSAEWWEKVTAQSSVHGQGTDRADRFADRPFVEGPASGAEEEPDGREESWGLLLKTARRSAPNKH